MTAMTINDDAVVTAVRRAGRQTYTLATNRFCYSWWLFVCCAPWQSRASPAPRQIKSIHIHLWPSLGFALSPHRPPWHHRHPLTIIKLMSRFYDDIVDELLSLISSSGGKQRKQIFADTVTHTTVTARFLPATTIVFQNCFRSIDSNKKKKRCCICVTIFITFMG